MYKEEGRVPVKEASQYQLSKVFRPPKEDTSDDVTKTAKGAFKSLGKAVSQVVGVEEHEGPRVKVIAFKLLDIVKMHDDFEKRNHGRSRHWTAILRNLAGRSPFSCTNSGIWSNGPSFADNASV
jgi:hypothetical protein